MRIVATILLWLPFFCFGQNRVDDPLPKANVISSLQVFRGWTKSDIGKWHSAPNALPTYSEDVRTYMPLCENVLKFDLAKVKIGDQDYFCVAKFVKHIFGKRREKTEYYVKYWLFDLSNNGSDSTGDNTKSKSFRLLHTESVMGFLSPITWTTVVQDLKKNFRSSEEVENRFIIVTRQDVKNKKTQFLFGAREAGSIKDLDFDLLCEGDDGNDTLGRMYYEIDTSSFNSFLNKMQ